MESKHAEEIMAMVKTHFSKATDGDAQLVWEDVRGCDFDDAHKAILAHRREKSAQPWRPDIQRIKVLAFNAMHTRRQAASKQIRVIDFIRQIDRGVCDMEAKDAIIHHFAKSWATVEAGNPRKGNEPFDPRGVLIARAYIRAHCRQALIEVETEKDEAETIASDCIGLQPNEKLKSAGIFGVDYQPNTSWEELKKLAINESHTVGVGDGI